MKHQDIHIEKKNPFVNCKLDRGKYAYILSAVVNSDPTGFVLAINGKWGTGKTTFVKMWKQLLENNGHKTIYFNAWENDFVSEPMVGILGELKTLTNSESEKLFNSILDKASKFSIKVIPALLKGLAKYHLGKEVSEIIGKGAEATTDIFEDEIKNYDEKKESLQALKEDLKKFIGEECENKPIVFIVDELDRCRPDYAVEVLEKIKHFFSVEGVVFVLSIDKKQLGNSIRGYYGSDRIDADEYLRRFIDIEYSLPEPNIEDFCKYLYIYFRYDDFFGNKERIQRSAFENDKQMFLKLSMQLSSENHLSLRQIEKLFSYTRLALKSFDSTIFVYPDLLFLMIYLKYYESDLYDIIRNHKINIQDLVNNIGEVFANNLKTDREEKYTTTFTNAIAKLIHFYNNYSHYNKRTNNNQSLIEATINDEVKEKLSFSSKNIDEDRLLQLLKHYRKTFEGFDMDLDFFTDKIDLLEPLQQIE